MQAQRALDERLFGLDVVGIGKTALDGTDGLASLLLVKANALGAELRVDDIDLVAFGDRLVGALGLAGPAVDAVFGDVGGHRRFPQKNPGDRRSLSTAERRATSVR